MFIVVWFRLFPTLGDAVHYLAGHFESGGEACRERGREVEGHGGGGGGSGGGGGRLLQRWMASVGDEDRVNVTTLDIS